MNRMILCAAIIASFALATGCQHFKRDRDDGTTEVQIAATDLPAAVRTSFDRDFPGAKIKKLEKETYADGTIHYEIEYTTADGKSAEVEYDASGEQLDEH